MKFTANRDQYSALEGLAYWAANIAALKERDPDNAHDRKRYGDTILDLFNQLDRLGVPYWVQNSALAAGENWRLYLQQGAAALLAKKGITRAA